MTKGQRRAGTQTLHISSSPISLCTSQDPLGRGEGGGLGGEWSSSEEGWGGELSTPDLFHAGIASLFLLGGKWKKQVTKR